MEISCLPRSRIAKIRPTTSIFHPAIGLSVLLQGIIHLFILNRGVHGANILSRAYCDDWPKKGLFIRLAQSSSKCVISTPATTNGKHLPKGNLLGRTPFQPNYVTNIVFLLSIFQNTMISIINHCGSPFHGSLLESKSFCIWSSISILFVILLSLELQPTLNKILQLAPMHSRSFRLFLVTLLALDGFLVYISDRMCIFFLDKNRWENLGTDLEYDETSELAADLEEKLLQVERNANKVLLRNIAWLSLLIIAIKFYPSGS